MKIVILDGHGANPGDLDWHAFEAIGDVTVYESTAPEDTLAHMADAPVVITNKTVLDADIIRQAKHLRYIGITATGYNVVDVKAAKERGIPVCNVPAYSTPAVAQHVFALLLELTNFVGYHHQAVQEGRWVSCPNFCFWDKQLMELNGKTMGIVGNGQIGRAVSRIAEAMGMRVLCCSKHDRPGQVPLETVLRESDVISLHCPLFADNTGMINKDTIAMMKDGVILINTARGALINEQDLRDALESGKVAAAGVDVVSVEPMRADNPLLGAPNCVITPHIAWAPTETRGRLLEIAANNIRAWMDGHTTNDVTASV